MGRNKYKGGEMDMFKIENGREAFYQWDLNQRLIVEDVTITEVHFSQIMRDIAFVCKVFYDDGEFLVNVPNILLQKSFPIKAYAYLPDYTKIENTFDVERKTKPSNYVYTETEVLQYGELEKRIEALESGMGGGGITNETDPTVPDWAKQPEKPTYTAEEVGALPSDTKIPSKLSDLSADTQHRTVTDVEKQKWDSKSNFSGNYSDLNGKPTIPSKTSELQNDSGFLTKHQDLSGYAPKESVPTKTSQLTNDSGFLTQHQDISGKADKATTLVGYGITDGATKESVDKLKKEVDNIGIPDTLPNPKPLTIVQGVARIEYDGSGAVIVTIPDNTGGASTERVEMAESDATIEPNKLYVFPEMATLNIALGESKNNSIANEYHFIFQSGATATTLAIPESVNVPSGFSVDANKIYEISILENNLCVQSWVVS